MLAWIVPLYTRHLSTNILLRVWDILIAESPKIFLTTALSLLTTMKEDLCKLPCGNQGETASSTEKARQIVFGAATNTGKGSSGSDAVDPSLVPQQSEIPFLKATFEMHQSEWMMEEAFVHVMHESGAPTASLRPAVDGNGDKSEAGRAEGGSDKNGSCGEAKGKVKDKERCTIA